MKRFPFLIIFISLLIGMQPSISMALSSNDLPSHVSTELSTKTPREKTISVFDDLFPEIHVAQAASVNTPREETHGGLTILSDKTINIDREIDGDVFAVGQNVTTKNTTYGDIFVAGQTITIAGTINGSLRAAGQIVHITGIVGNNALIFAEEIIIDPNAIIHGHANLYAKRITIDGIISQRNEITAQNILLRGTLGGTSTLTAETINITEKATLEAATIIRDAEQLSLAQNFKGRNNITIDQTPHKNSKNERDHTWFWSYLFFVMMGILIILLFPTWIEHGIDAIEKRFTTTWARGIVALVVLPVITLILFLTIIGIPLAILLILATIFLVFVGHIFPSLYVGHFLFHGRGGKSLRTQRISQLILGHFILSMIWTIPIIGWFINVGVTVWGMGIIMTLPIVRKISRTKRKK